MSKEVAIKENAGVPQVIGAEQFDMDEQMEGVEVQLPVIKIVHLGQMFAFPDGTKVEKFKGTMIDSNRTNAYWHKSFDESGGGGYPDCSSVDGVTPAMDSNDVQHSQCAGCPKNQMGSGENGGKACKNIKRLHIIVEGTMLPHRLVASAKNIKEVDGYISYLRGKNIPYPLRETEFSLAKASSNKGKEYSRLVLSDVGATPMVETTEDAVKLKALIDQWKPVFRGEVGMEDTEGGE